MIDSCFPRETTKQNPAYVPAPHESCISRKAGAAFSVWGDWSTASGLNKYSMINIQFSLKQYRISNTEHRISKEKAEKRV
jgi:hypothetical protein